MFTPYLLFYKCITWEQSEISQILFTKTVNGKVKILNVHIIFQLCKEFGKKIRYLFTCTLQVDAYYVNNQKEI